MLGRTHANALSAFATVCAITGATPAAIAATAAFTEQETRDLDAGHAVIHTIDYARGAHRYVGGLSYEIIEAAAADLSTIVRDVSRGEDLLPHLVEARVVSIAPSGLTTVAFTHAFGPFSGSYALVMAFSEGGNLGRFWISPSDGGVVSDGWGFIRLTPLADAHRTLVTYALLFDLGPGVLRSLFETKIRDLALQYPARLAHAAHRS